MQLGSKQSKANFITILLAFALAGCNDSTPWTTQVCDSCNWDAAKIEFVDALPTDSVEFSEAIAIEYFNIANQKFPDSATADKFYNNHQWRYRVVDQHGYYFAIVRPVLERCNIQITDTIKYRNVLFFTDDLTEYIVDARPYRSQDGVLLFTPGRAPIFWTAEVFRTNCQDTTFVKCYFGK